ncbi:MAG TPA: CAP domain-containing protein [Candidatus Binataceae bacterium]|nr:CAP domain-containing protein [Candidatus Binataceae bacterium]
MSGHSASGRGSLRIPKGPAKVIPLPTGARRRRGRRTAGVGLASLGVALAGGVLVWFYFVPPGGVTTDPMAGMSAQEAEILRLVNDERQRSDAPPLKLSRRLMLASRGHSYDMALRNYLGHYGPAGDTPGERASSVGVNSGAIGENLYQDRDRDGAHLAERAIRRWLGDKERRTNMLSRDFATTGIGIARAADGTAYVTEDFAR